MKGPPEAVGAELRFSVLAGGAEATVAAVRARQLVHQDELRTGHGGDDELGDPLAAGERDRLAAVVHEDDPHLAAVVGVDRSGGVHHADAEPQRQAGARPDLPLVAGRNLDREPGGDEPPLADCERHRLVGAEIEPRGAAGLVAGEIERRTALPDPPELDRDVHRTSSARAPERRPGGIRAGLGLRALAALGLPGRLGERLLAGEADLAGAVDVDDLHHHLLALGEDVGDAPNLLVGELGDVDEAVGAREDLHEGCRLRPSLVTEYSTRGGICWWYTRAIS